MDGLSITGIESIPAEVPKIANWIEHEWKRLPIHDYFDAVAQNAPWPAALPRTLVAINQSRGDVIGTVSLLTNDMETRPDLNPWIGCLFVPAEWRNRGIGAALMREGEVLARSLHITQLYLFAARETMLYERLGWVGIGREFYEDSWTTLMLKKLT